MLVMFTQKKANEPSYCWYSNREDFISHINTLILRRDIEQLTISSCIPYSVTFKIEACGQGKQPTHQQNTLFRVHLCPKVLKSTISIYISTLITYVFGFKVLILKDIRKMQITPYIATFHLSDIIDLSNSFPE